MAPKIDPVQSLLDQAKSRYQAAMAAGDLVRAAQHKQIYLALWPLAFADVMLRRLTQQESPIG